MWMRASKAPAPPDWISSLRSQVRQVFSLPDFCHVQFCGAARSGHSRLSAGIGELWIRCHSGTSDLGRRLRARLPAPLME